MSSINVFGAGAFGTALAVVTARRGHNVTLVARSQDRVAEMLEDRENKARLPGISLPSNLVPSLTPAEDAEVCLLVVPTQTLSQFASEHADFLANRIGVACCKGVDLTSGTGPTGVLNSIVPSMKAAILSGPGFAADIAAGLPTALTLASNDPALTKTLQGLLSTETLRLYRSDDVTGVELGGALKNVVALAAGITIGAGLGESARAAVITRGYAEMKRFAISRGARPETLSGLSGLGDLVLTATSAKSRNYVFGHNLGGGSATLRDQTVEGIATAEIVSNLGTNEGLDLPITDTVASLTKHKLTIAEAVSSLMSRPLKEE